MTIYCFKLNSEVVYVGQTIQEVKKRISSHYSNSKRTYPINRAIKKYGKKITWEVLEVCDSQQELDYLEKYYIKHYAPKYNISLGGKSNFVPWNKGKKEQRKSVLQNISKSAKSRKRTKRGTYSKEHRSRISDGVKKSVRTPFICENNGKIYYNKIDCAKELGIDPRGISIVLLPTTRLKTYKGYKFRYI